MSDTFSVAELGNRAKSAAPILANATTDLKNSALLAAADLVLSRQDEIIQANLKDLDLAKGILLDSALDRLRLDKARIESMSHGLRQVAALADPIGEITHGWTRPNGLQISKLRVPLGVIGIIYENRPNVTSDAAGLCIKSGNVAFLRGSSTAINSNRSITNILRDAFSKEGLPKDVVVLLEETSHGSAVEFMKLEGVIDCLIPRGGPTLMKSIKENAKVPYILDGDGNCHVFVDSFAQEQMAIDIVVNSKTSRPGVCNAAESLLVHESIAESFLPKLAKRMQSVEIVGDQATKNILPSVSLATEDDFASEFLSLKISVGIVKSLDQAIQHIRRYGTGHTEAIVTSNLENALRFTKEVDAAAVVVNASTRFTDGEQFGYGAEIGISTQKLHARGPLGLSELTTLKYVVMGQGQVRK